ncbi:hypothetical protein KVV02_004863 [Mortierella alpina]|uniref:Uncharacterized protein n=1 Tax=Mortierella alpina TaxID=64518 RepID=A0A9P8AAC6_MORAP|nr:hypothetical protein KVV02_004863 [Mortierella alpina]
MSRFVLKFDILATVVIATPEFASPLKPGNCLNLRDQCVDQSECCPNLTCDQSRGECVRREDAESRHRRRHRRPFDEVEEDEEDFTPWTEGDTFDEYGRLRNGLRRRDRDDMCRKGLYWDPMRGKCVRSRWDRMVGRRHRRNFMDDYDEDMDSDDWMEEDLRRGSRGKSCLVFQQSCSPGQCCRGLTCDQNLRECLPDPRYRRNVSHKYRHDLDRNRIRRDFDHRIRRDLGGSRSNFGQHCTRNSQCSRDLMCDKGLRQCVDDRRRYRRDFEEVEL